MSAPPEPRAADMSAPPHDAPPSNVRHIPIFVEGRDEPVINKRSEPAAHFSEPKQTYGAHPQSDRDQYFNDDGHVGFHPPPNFSRAFGTPFNKGYRQTSQPFVQQKVYPQNAFARGASPQRSQSPKPPEDYVKVPVHHDPPKSGPKSPQQSQPPPQRAPQQNQPPPAQPHSAPQREQTPPQAKPQQPSSNDPITIILSIQTDVLNLMSEVENFTGTKKDKKYLFLDEMLTRNLIKLDNIETDGKENIRQARKEAIKCIQKCIAVLEAKAESGSQQAQAQAQTQSQNQTPPQDVEMNDNSETKSQTEQVNGEVEMKDVTKDKQESQGLQTEEKPKDATTEPKTQENKEGAQTQNAVPAEMDPETTPASTQSSHTDKDPVDTRPDDNATQEAKSEQKEDDKEKKSNPKKVTKTVKKRDKSKDKKDSTNDSNKDDNVETNSFEQRTDAMAVDEKGDKTDSQVMEVDGAASQ